MSFDEVVDRRTPGSIKWNYYSEDVIPLWIADMDFRCPPCIHDALSEHTDHNLHGYNKPSRGLINAVLSMLKENYDWDVKASSLVWLPGMVTALNIACRAFCQKDQKVIVPTPVYSPFLEAPGYSEKKLTTVELKDDGSGYKIDFETLENEMKDAGLYLLCNPHNPVGRCFSEEELKKLADLCLENDTVICSDEIHCDLILDKNKKHIPLATLSKEIEKKTVTLMSPSKTFNTPGLAFAFAVIPNYKLRKKFLRVMQGIVPYPGTPGRIAAEAAYTNGGTWKNELIDYLRINRDLLSEFINKNIPQIIYTPGEATYLAWLNISKLNLENPCRHFAKFGIGLSDGEKFGKKGFVRLNFACPKSVLEEALNRLKKACRAI